MKFISTKLATDKVYSPLKKSLSKKSVIHIIGLFLFQPNSWLEIIAIIEQYQGTTLESFYEWTEKASIS